MDLATLPLTLHIAALQAKGDGAPRPHRAGGGQEPGVVMVEHGNGLGRLGQQFALGVSNGLL